MKLSSVASLACFGATAFMIGAAVIRNSGPPRPSVESEVWVTPEVLAQALASDVPERLTMTDELEFFERRLAEHGPEDVLGRRRIVSASLLRFQAYGQEDDLARAERHLASLSKRYPTSSGVWSSVASAKLSRHDFPGAVEASEHSVRVAGADDGDTRLRLFDAYLATGRYQEAQELLSLPFDRSTFAFRTRSIRLQDRLGDVVGAREGMEATLETLRSYAQPRAIVAWNLVELGHFEQHSGRPGQAVGHYREALGLLPGHAAAIEGMAQVAFGFDRDLNVAEALFLKALNNGGHLDLYLRLIEVAEGAGSVERAERYRERFLTAAQADESTQRLNLRPLALTLGQEDETLDQALHYARRDLTLRHTSESYAVLGWILSRLGRTSEAWMWIEAAQAWVQPEPEVDYLSGLVALDAGRPDRGKELLSRALAAEAEIGPIKSERIRQFLGSVD
jgi:tetratricopeptide (TPR) repeat protein